jgi:hypothetical protein
MNSYNPQIRAQQLAAQRKATDAAAHHLPGAAPAAGPASEPKGVLKFQDTVIDHAAKLRGAIAQTLQLFDAIGGARQALDYLRAVQEAGYLGAADQPQSRMDAGSGPACSPLTAQQVDKIENHMIASLDKPLTSTQREGMLTHLVAHFRALNAMGVRP